MKIHITLHKFIQIYSKFDIPKESFIISLYYLYNFYNINKNDKLLMNNYLYYFILAKGHHLCQVQSQ